MQQLNCGSLMGDIFWAINVIQCGTQYCTARGACASCLFRWSWP